ncbi:hypothetical protein KL918_003881 [Ogataea parapolymorpha]|nr:hypothetical protein KL918_003881 [Ogataea parapolymorpha]KAG7874954.1 hypothetical protein KL916_001199 [Ogataea parapolymorpha]
MGNTPAKETRSPSGSFSKDNVASPKSLVGLSKRKKERDREKRRQKEQHMLDLIVRYQENVDGGYLAPYGNYKDGLNYKTDVVRELIIERKLAPFYTPLEDFDENWTDSELLSRLKRLKLHAPTSESFLDEDEDPDDHKIHQSASSMRRKEHKAFKRHLSEMSIKFQRDAESRFTRDKSVSESGIKSYPNIPSDDLLLTLYRNAVECPICFLYYPPNLNLSRCCVQPICTECFVQLKRLDPHPPHDEGAAPNTSSDSEKIAEELISEPVNCPFCAMSDFGVTYSPPNLWTGIGGRPPRDFNFIPHVIHEDPETNQGPSRSREYQRKASLSYAMTKSHSASGTPPKKSTIFSEYRTNQGQKSFEDSVSINSKNSDNSSQTKNVEGFDPARRRRGSLPATAPGVITVDLIHPDWEQKLLNAKSKLARRSAAATALHASSLIYDRDESQHTYTSRLERSYRRSDSSNGNDHNSHTSIEERMIEEALKLSLLDEEERKLKERLKR